MTTRIAGIQGVISQFEKEIVKAATILATRDTSVENARDMVDILYEIIYLVPPPPPPPPPQVWGVLNPPAHIINFDEEYLWCWPPYLARRSAHAVVYFVHPTIDPEVGTRTCEPITAKWEMSGQRPSR